MSFQTLKRTAPFFALLLLTVPAAMAAAPSSRTGARAAYDPLDESVVMFGGVTSPDLATGRAYEPNETWEFDGTRWIRRFPAGEQPPGRSSHVMVYDSNRARMIVFGGRTGNELRNDTWVYRGDWFNREWVQIDTPNAPAARQFAAAAFDPLRDRMILFGGQEFVENEEGDLTSRELYDMWEFDGTTWTRVLESGPQIRKPLLTYDESRDQVILLGHDAETATQMYVWDRSAEEWSQVTPEDLPPCVNESGIAYDSDKQLVYIMGGVCIPPSNPQNSSKTTDELYAWDGTNWELIEDERTLFRTSNAAFAYDARWKELVLFGGTLAYTNSSQATTFMYRDDNWITPPRDITSPGPRSLYAMAPDPVRGVVWLYGGQSDVTIYSDLWKFEDGFWHLMAVENTPFCSSPLMAFDTDRARLVLVCTDSATHEFDGETWTAFPDVRTKPDSRRFSHLVYDQALRRTVLYGGFNDIGDYVDKTWTWNGTVWTEVKANRRPHFRALSSMWYDPVLRKTVLFGGIGRQDREGRLHRFNDMWSFDGSTWTEIKPAAMPSTRYGAQIAVDPTTNRTILFGGLRVETTDAGVQRQVYADDTWEWNGSTWRQLATDPAPPARENATMVWDPTARHFLLFGGWAGHYLSDTWRLADGRWHPYAE
ncbi:MAG TPA: kelch repeat-containing protein [Thermoanaerobaculia bacterium]|nr:kelch repeat-containing protein [Thermoanaerobaculia bacterium]